MTNFSIQNMKFEKKGVLQYCKSKIPFQNNIKQGFWNLPTSGGGKEQEF